jgi:preprotein translocase subunit SecA
MISPLKNLGYTRSRKSTRRDRELVRSIRRAAADLEPLPETQLRHRADELRSLVEAGRSAMSPDVLVPSFALVNEAARRTIGITFYDVQLLAGLALTRGAVAQMQTGEGKTFVAALPAFVHALVGRGVHVMTSNSYLAERDHKLMSPVFECLGMSVGRLQQQSAPAQKQAAYASDVTYGPGYEFGFDYLRDQVMLRRSEESRLGQTLLSRLRGAGAAPQQRVQRGLACAIVDEVHHVLIDDAGSPLIISQATADTAEDAQAHLLARSLVPDLREGGDYRFDAAAGLAQLTSRGSEIVHSDEYPVPWKVLLRPWSEYVEQALRVELLMRRDVHYVVQEGEVRVVDESTGRIFAERSWRDGLHQAIEAKEGVTITADKRSIARITRQRFFRLYDRRCGMTGTAVGSEAEFREFYGLNVVVIPLHKPGRRTVCPSRCFADDNAKWSAVVEEVRQVHASGRPVLVGTRSIVDSETLAQRLQDRDVPHLLLNGVQDADEAGIVAQAGRSYAVTIATNMAGRGTDIKLGRGVAEKGGLHVIATQRHSSRRIDRQLIGRCARQGDPGSARFFLSADDEIIRTHRPWLARTMRRAANSQGEILADFDFAIRHTQRVAEKTGHRRRRQLFHSDRQRDTSMAKFAGEDRE